MTCIELRTENLIALKEKGFTALERIPISAEIEKMIDEPECAVWLYKPLNRQASAQGNETVDIDDETIRAIAAWEVPGLAAYYVHGQ